MPGANESSTDEWHNAQVMPTRVSCPVSLIRPCTPTTAFNRINSTVTAGSFRSSSPAWSAAVTARGKASTSTLRPTANAVAGGTVAIASCIRSTSVHNCSSPNVSKRKIA